MTDTEERNSEERHSEEREEGRDQEGTDKKGTDKKGTGQEEADHDDMDHEEFSNSGELERQKRNVNEFNARGNTAQTQIFIQNLNGSLSDFFKSSKAIKTEIQEKRYDLKNKVECIEFIEKYRDSQCLIIAVILSVFRRVALGDLPELQMELMKYLPETGEDDSEEAKGQIQWEPYRSVDSILAVMNGKRFEAKDGRVYIGLEDGTEKVLNYIMEQFPVLKQSILDWLFRLLGVHQYRTGLDAYQIMAAFARVIAADFMDAEAKIFPRFYSDSDNTGMLANLAYYLYENTALSEYLQVVIVGWIKSASWLWKPACLAYAFLSEKENTISFENLLEKSISRRVLMPENMIFTAGLLKQYTGFRSMVTRILGIHFKAAHDRNEKLYVARAYLNLVRYCYYQVDSVYVQLALVACDKKEQQEDLAPVIRQVMSASVLRRQLYIILKTYLNEISNYKVDSSTINYIAAYFCNMASSDRIYWRDVQFFLEQNRNDVTLKIIERLQRVNSKRRQVSYE